jgi:hypothetical protein
MKFCARNPYCLVLLRVGDTVEKVKILLEIYDSREKIMDVIGD